MPQRSLFHVLNGRKLINFSFINEYLFDALHVAILRYSQRLHVS
ncbi:hypothetical protein SynBIOSU31_03057 [Synechococcus sp. BIOS-U3-1]|nr:hypothetical protein SynBIOSU31_03057 [Synechococcus sp. BIOS-U3-1]